MKLVKGCDIHTKLSARLIAGDIRLMLYSWPRITQKRDKQRMPFKQWITLGLALMSTTVNRDRDVARAEKAFISLGILSAR